MGATRRELIERMDSAELSEWAAFDAIDPIGPERFDVHAALIRQSVEAPHLKKGRPLRDYLTKWGPPEPQSVEQAKRALRRSIGV
jgi:hypothetical protein